MKILRTTLSGEGAREPARSYRRARRESLNFEVVGGETHYRNDILALHIGSVHEVRATVELAPVEREPVGTVGNTWSTLDRQEKGSLRHEVRATPQ